MSRQSKPHGTLSTYVIGFILSLLLTLVPYSLVVNQTITGTALLITILAFAVVQLLVQVTFFLHLGREPKPNWNLYFLIATVGLIVVVIGGSILIMNNLHYNMMPSDQSKKLVNDEGIYQIGGKATGACQGQHANHQVVIKNGHVNPSITFANKCDTLTFINNDNQSREVAFGEHEHHDAYAGETEILLKKGRNETITLSDVGTIEFHDHLDPSVAGTFIVAQQ